MTETESIQSFNQLKQNPEAAFHNYWTAYGIPKAKQDGGKWVTPAYNHGAFEKRLHATREELDNRGLEDEPALHGLFKHGMAQALGKANKGDEPGAGVPEDVFNEMRTHGIIDQTVVDNSTPAVFDPDILQLLKETAPLAFDRVTRRGQGGFEGRFNRVDEREAPLGKVPESVATRLQDYARDFNLEREDVPMTIYADTAEVSDFSAQASAHYMDISDLAIGARMAEHALFHEQELLYGDPEGGLEGGSPLGPEANIGLSTWLDGAGQSEDKSALDIGSDSILEEIKWEIRQLLQGPYAIRPQDLEVWMSWSLFDHLENEFTNVGARFFIDVSDLDFGDYNLSVGGIQAFPSHNVAEHEYVAQDTDGDEQDPWDPYEEGDTGYDTATTGSVGDCFIVNRATFEVRELAPLSTFPLAVRGAADEIALIEYGSFVERSGGNFGFYLENIANGEFEPNTGT